MKVSAKKCFLEEDALTSHHVVWEFCLECQANSSTRYSTVNKMSGRTQCYCSRDIVAVKGYSLSQVIFHFMHDTFTVACSSSGKCHAKHKPEGEEESFNKTPIHNKYIVNTCKFLTFAVLATVLRAIPINSK